MGSNLKYILELCTKFNYVSVIWLYIWHHSGRWGDFSYLGRSKNYWTELTQHKMWKIDMQRSLQSVATSSEVNMWDSKQETTNN